MNRIGICIVIYIVIAFVPIWLDWSWKQTAIKERRDSIKQFLFLHGSLEMYEICYIPDPEMTGKKGRSIWCKFSDGYETRLRLDEFFEYSTSGRFQHIPVSDK